MPTGPSAASPSVSIASGPGPELRLESDFETTPLFDFVLTETDGSGRLNFTAPPNLGTFVVRAFAVSGTSSLSIES